MASPSAPLIFRTWYYRLATGIVAGPVTWLLAEVLLNLRYRYFIPFSLPVNYAYAMVLGILVVETYFRSGKLLDRFSPWEKGPVKRLMTQLLAGILIAFFWIALVRVGIMLILHPGKLIILEDEMIVIALVIVLLMMISIGELGYFINERYRLSLAEVERFRKENAEYQFEMLKLQLNPHFLFNSLNTLSSLVYEDSGKASEFIRRLSEVYRYVLDNRSKELVTLKEEMEFISAFTFLQGLRFQGMIDFRFDISDDTLERKIAPMTMQLLIENAVKHNVASRKMPLTISIGTEDGKLIISNNFQPKEEQPGTGVGLKNIVNRYAFLTDKKVEIIRNQEFFKVIIPLI